VRLPDSQARSPEFKLQYWSHHPTPLKRRTIEPCMMAQPVNLALRWLRVEDCEFKYNLSYTVKLSKKEKTKS
jgi:hypothetical protein